MQWFVDLIRTLDESQNRTELAFFILIGALIYVIWHSGKNNRAEQKESNELLRQTLNLFSQGIDDNKVSTKQALDAIGTAIHALKEMVAASQKETETKRANMIAAIEEVGKMHVAAVEALQNNLQSVSGFHHKENTEHHKLVMKKLELIMKKLRSLDTLAKSNHDISSALHELKKGVAAVQNELQPKPSIVEPAGSGD